MPSHMTEAHERHQAVETMLRLRADSWLTTAEVCRALGWCDHPRDPSAHRRAQSALITLVSKSKAERRPNVARFEYRAL